MLVFSENTHVICANNPDNENLIQIIPGWSELSKDEWDIVKNMRLIELKMKDRKLRTHKSKQKFIDLPRDEADVVLKETYGLVVLNGWITDEEKQPSDKRRVDFISAIERHKRQLIEDVTS